MNELVKRVISHIKDNWGFCVREHKRYDNSELIALPYPYTVPCVNESFQALFYWDTYFTNIGLIRLGFLELAKNNVDNFLWEIERFGYIPNANMKCMLNRSQPPYLSMMVWDIYEVYKDKEWLLNAYNTLKKEYEFWVIQRHAACGLSRYYHNDDTDENKLGFFNYISTRVGLEAESYEKKLLLSSHYLAEAETGWDFNPRFNARCADYIPIDLNCNLYMYEKNFDYFSRELGLEEEEDYITLAQNRRKNINKYCWDNEKGLFFDYNYVDECKSEILSSAIYHAMWSGLADDVQAKLMHNNLSLLECDFGVVQCQKGERKTVYQWDYPNGWPPSQYVIMKGLERYGYIETARRIAGKYVYVVCKNYSKTNDIWEKYNVVDGSINVSDEYEMPKMMGWTAGAFLASAEICGYDINL